jgi:hypothetical protein
MKLSFYILWAALAAAMPCLAADALLLTNVSVNGYTNTNKLSRTWGYSNPSDFAVFPTPTNRHAWKADFGDGTGIGNEAVENLANIYRKTRSDQAEEEMYRTAMEQFHRALKLVQWGPETNQFRMGLRIEYSPNTNRTEVACFAVVRNTLTNSFDDYMPARLLLPPLEWRFRMILLDSDGSAVEMTAWAKEQIKGEPWETAPHRTKGRATRLGNQNYDRWQLVPGGEPGLTMPFYLNDYFNITKSGKYHLKIELRAVTEIGLTPAHHPIFKEYILPASADVEIKKP